MLLFTLSFLESLNRFDLAYCNVSYTNERSIGGGVNTPGGVKYRAIWEKNFRSIYGSLLNTMQDKITRNIHGNRSSMLILAYLNL